MILGHRALEIFTNTLWKLDTAQSHAFLSASRAMDADDSVDDWSSDNESERQLCNDSSRNIELARSGRLPQQSQRRPALKTLPFVPYADWVADQSYDELPLSCMHYNMEWKLTMNRRVVASKLKMTLS
jgi:hypothetical protein